MVGSGIAGNILRQIQASVGAPSQSGLNGWPGASKKRHVHWSFIGALALLTATRLLNLSALIHSWL